MGDNLQTETLFLTTFSVFVDFRLSDENTVMILIGLNVLVTIILEGVFTAKVKRKQ